MGENEEKDEGEGGIIRLLFVRHYNAGYFCLSVRDHEYTYKQKVGALVTNPMFVFIFFATRPTWSQR